VSVLSVIRGAFSQPAPLPPPPASPEPAPPKPPQTSGLEPQFRQTRADRVNTLDVTDVSASRIVAALRMARLGYLKGLGDLEDVMYSSGPVLPGILEQRCAGINDVSKEILPGDDSPEAAIYAEEFKREIERPEASWALFERECVYLKLCGGGLLENLWSLDVGSSWHIAGFKPIPRQRTRFNPETGEIGFAYNIYDLYGFGVSTFLPGTWSAVVVDERIMDFGKRGALRSVIKDWWDTINVGDWYNAGLERWGIPIIDVATDDPIDRAAAIENGPTMGADGVIVHSLEKTKLTAFQKAPDRSAIGSVHREFEESRRGRWAIRFCGAEQTVSVTDGQGSQQSAGLQGDMRLQIVKGDAELVQFVGRRDVAVPWVVRNYGPAAASKAPVIRYQFEEEIDVGTVLTNIQQAEDRGMDIAVVDAYEAIGFRKPEPGEKTLRDLREANAKRAGVPVEGSGPVPAPDQAAPAGEPPPPLPFPSRGKK
jgi:hypothetical protein